MTTEEKVKHTWTVLCEKSITDSGSNNFTLVNVTEQLNISKSISVQTGEAPELNSNPQVIPFNRELVTLWRRASKTKIEPFKFDVRVEFIDPKGKILQSADLNQDFQHFRRLRTRIVLPGLPITLAGEYIFRMSVKNNKNFEVVAEVPLEIALRVTGVNESQAQFDPS